MSISREGGIFNLSKTASDRAFSELDLGEERKADASILGAKEKNRTEQKNSR
jgi:hypothetical protein